MLSRAAETVGLEWKPPPRPEPSRLSDWFLRVARTGSQEPRSLPGRGQHLLLPETDLLVPPPSPCSTVVQLRGIR